MNIFSVLSKFTDSFLFDVRLVFAGSCMFLKVLLRPAQFRVYLSLFESTVSPSVVLSLSKSIFPSEKHSGTICWSTTNFSFRESTDSF